MLALAINKKHYAPEGIRETRTFSVNIPSVDLLTETDYCGIVSGRNVDKSKVFSLFLLVLFVVSFVLILRLLCSVCHTIHYHALNYTQPNCRNTTHKQKQRPLDKPKPQN